MTPADEDLLTALRSARPDPGYRPSPHSPQATRMLAGILGTRREPPRPRRVTRRRLVLAGLPILAVAISAAVVTVSVAPAGSAPGRPAAARVRIAILDALRQRSGDILSIQTTDQLYKHGRPQLHTYGGRAGLRGWLYPAFPAVGQQVRYRAIDSPKGQPDQDVESIYTQTAAMEHLTMRTTQGPRSAKIVGVDYPSRTWARFTTTTVPVTLNGSPALIRSGIASGHFTVGGTVKLHGRAALKVSWVSSVPGGTDRVTIWVDARTYVPLRMVWASWWGPGETLITTCTYQLRPATATSLNLLNPVIPPGFTQARQIPGFERAGS